MANKKKNRRKFGISGELTWIHVVIFLALCLVFVRETRFTFGGGLIKDIPDVGEISSEYLSDYEDFDEGEGVDNHAAAGDDDEENLNNESNENEGITLRGAKGGETSYIHEYLMYFINTLTICDPNDSSVCITMMDRNLGATESGTGCSHTKTGTCGYHYQWGNNHGFLLCTTSESCTSFPGGERTETDNIIDVTQYGPGNWFNRDIFIKIDKANPWSRFKGNHNNLWGGSGDSVSNNRGYDLSNHTAINASGRRGPCPDGYHVPSAGEWNKLLEYWSDWYILQGNNLVLSGGGLKKITNNKTGAITFLNDFKIPMAGHRGLNAGMANVSFGAELWSSSPTDNDRYYYTRRSLSVYPTSWLDSSRTDYNPYGFSIRCFKDSPLILNNSFIISLYDGKEKIGEGLSSDGIVLKPTDPEKTGYLFKGWHESNNNTLFDFNTLITENLDLYADWDCITGYHKNGEICEINTYVVTRKNWDGEILGESIEKFGTIPQYDYEWGTPEKIATEQYYYTFAGWDPAVGKVVENVTYTATFTELLQQYQIYWWIGGNNGDQSRGQEYGSSIQPIETGNLQNDGYIFVGWYADKNLSRPFNFKNTIVTSDINIYAKWESCPKGTIVVNNKCISSDSIGVFYTGGMIKITDGDKTYYIKDRNQGSSNISLDKVIQLRDLLGKECAYQEVCVKYCNDDCSGPCEAKPVYEGQYNCSETFYEQASQIIGYGVLSYDEVQKFIDNYNRYRDPDYSGTYYYRGNNNGATYDELNVDGENIDIKEETYMRGFNGGRIGEPETGWELSGINNPCDASKGEYLPTVEDWNGMLEVYNNVTRFGGNILEDLLIPEAGNIYYYDSSMESRKGGLSFRQIFGGIAYADYMAISNKHRGGSLLWLAGSDTQNNDLQVECDDKKGGDEACESVSPIANKGLREGGNNVKVFAVNDGRWINDYTSTSNGIAAPVRCFVHVIEEKDEDKLHDVKPSGNGGGNQLKRDNCPNGDYSDSYYDGDCGKKPTDKEDVKETDDKKVTEKDTEEKIDKHNSSDKVVYDTLKYNPHYSDEMNQAYQYSYHYGITTKTSIKNADVNGKLTRVAMAKMLSQYAINVLGIEPDTSRFNTFSDVSDKLDSDYDDGVTLAYQLGIMGINMPNNEFRPYGYVTRAEFATALSRLLYNTSDGDYEKTSRYYVPHINKLAYEGILTNTDPTMKELRGYVMLMLMRSDK